MCILSKFWLKAMLPWSKEKKLLLTRPADATADPNLLKRTFEFLINCVLYCEESWRKIAGTSSLIIGLGLHKVLHKGG